MKTKILILLVLAGALCFGQTTRRLTSSELNQGFFTVTIAASGTVSEGVLVRGQCVLAGIQIPAAWDTANLTFQETTDGSTFVAVTDDSGTARTVTVAAAARLIRFSNLADWTGIYGIKLVSTATQTAERSIKVLCPRF